jgi:hypothetical protein
MSQEVSESETEHPVECQVEQERRDALREIGLYAAYTAPALLVMLGSALAAPADSAV